MQARAEQTASLTSLLFPKAVELDCPVSVVEGKIPAALKGTLYQNRPGSFGAGSLAYKNWLDGDGFLTALWISGGSAWLKSRFVETQKRRDEGQSGAALYRTFATRFPGDQLVQGVALASPANIHVQLHEGRLLAFGEQGAPLEIDPRTLATKGVADYGGLLNESSPYSAHAKLDGDKLVNFGVEYHPTKPRLHCFHFGGKNRTASFALDGPRSAHDFALSPRHLVLHLPPYFLDTNAFASGKTFLEALTWRPERGLRLVLVDRQTLQPTRRFEAESRYAMHLVGARETAGATELFALESPEPLYGEFDLHAFCLKPRRTELVRYTLPAAGDLRRDVMWENDRMLDFPVTDGAHVWGLGSSQAHRSGEKFFDELWRWNESGSEVFRAPTGTYFCGDPVCAGGWITVFAACRTASEAWIFDKQALRSGPVARLRLPARLPVPVHGTFVR